MTTKEPSNKRGKLVSKVLRDQVLARYFELSTPVFTPEMGKRLARVRHVMRLTQRQLAERLGLRQVDISRLENGKMVNAPINSAKFSFVLEEHFEYLLTRSGYHRYEDITEEYNKQIRKDVLGSKSSLNVR